MQAYVLLTSKQSPDIHRGVEEALVQRIERELPGVKWLMSYAIFGPHDRLDLFEAPSSEVAYQVASLLSKIRRIGLLWPAKKHDLPHAA